MGHNLRAEGRRRQEPCRPLGTVFDMFVLAVFMHRIIPLEVHYQTQTPKASTYSLESGGPPKRTKEVSAYRAASAGPRVVLLPHTDGPLLPRSSSFGWNSWRHRRSVATKASRSSGGEKHAGTGPFDMVLDFTVDSGCGWLGQPPMNSKIFEGIHRLEKLLPTQKKPKQTFAAAHTFGDLVSWALVPEDSTFLMPLPGRAFFSSIGLLGPPRPTSSKRDSVGCQSRLPHREAYPARAPCRAVPT